MFTPRQFKYSGNLKCDKSKNGNFYHGNMLRDKSKNGDMSHGKLSRGKLLRDKLPLCRLIDVQHRTNGLIARPTRTSLPIFEK
jgi:hypothetical protein